ncbi:thermonuclease family protein [Sinorhizobium sp. BG8]|uniref:thermonuclease family protein n=1 Tax=Sinorhizobium sp. BG8 TaxID=2613773 RepID=UPI001AF172FC|nr:thermonuclease family protein [Sinorhizobium sp. BG8]QRM55718.1 thermonuclease family protein [Sinorhizobium sp. BG8]
MGKAWSRGRDIVTAGAILGLVLLIVMRVGGEEAVSVTGTARAADGDTLTLNGVRIRLTGFDAPELAQICTRGDGEWKCGLSARARLAELLRTGTVSCETRGTDRYGRTLGACSSGEGDIGAIMVREGLAVSYGDYGAEEDVARAEHRGLWSGTFEQPQAWRQLHGRPQEDPHITQRGWLGFILGVVGIE